MLFETSFQWGSEREEGGEVTYVVSWMVWAEGKESKLRFGKLRRNTKSCGPAQISQLILHVTGKIQFRVKTQ